MNPVSSSHINFSVHEAMGVVGIVPDTSSSLLGLVSLVAPVVAGGNTCIVIASEDLPLCSVTFAEVLNSSDVPGGVINILTGSREEMMKPLAGHMDVNAIAIHGSDNEVAWLNEQSVLNLKRVRSYKLDWSKAASQHLYLIEDFLEVKTTWHPIENIGGATSTY